MDSLIGYGSDDEVENERYGGHHASVDHSGVPGSSRRRDDDTNYDDVNMDMSEDSQAESEPELPQAEPAPSSHHYRDDWKGPDELSRSGSSRDERERRRESPARDRDRSDRRERRDDRYSRSEKGDRGRGSEAGARRGLLGDRPDDKHADSKVPALMDLKPFGGEPPPGLERRSHDARDAVSPRFTEHSRRSERSRERSRERRPARRSEERRHKHAERRDRSRSRSRPASSAHPPPSSHSSSGSSERRPSPPSEGQYRPSSYKVNKKLEVMEKMGLQIKTPSGSMATAQQLRAAACEPQAARRPAPALPSYYNASAVNSTKILDQVNKRKLLWANKAKNEQEEAAKWSGTRFAQDNDGKQVSKFMRLMGIKDPDAVKPEANKTVDPIKKQEELFQAMQAQYEVARATTHTMRGVGLGFQRGQF